ncbi:MAG: TonB-dependent receptor, partial [Vicinamibacterales bacterium]
VEWNGVLSSNAFVQVVAGAMKSLWYRNSKSAGPRIEDIGNNFVSGGVFGIDNARFRPQTNGSLTWVHEAHGSHNFKFGGEMMYETLSVPFRGFQDSRNAVSVFNNGVPNQVRVYLAPSKSDTGLWNYSAYANDSWQLSRRTTLTLGIRWDRNRSFLPAQTGPKGEAYAAVDKVALWNNIGPRVGLAYDVTGDARTVVKVNYGKFFLFPAADFAANANANSQTWFNTYAWNDPNKNGVYDLGEEAALQSVSGGTLSAILDPALRNSYQHQASVFLEREVARNFGVRTGVVWKGPRDPRGTYNPNRPLSAYDAPVSVRDPGPDGIASTADDGGTFTAYGLSAAALAAPIVSLTGNFPGVESDYYTWEISANKRGSSVWSTNASFAKTWTYADPLGAGVQTPNSLIGVTSDRVEATSWQAKSLTTLELPWDLRLVSVIRHQSGTQFERTFTTRLNYGNATIRAEGANSRRTPNITLLDFRSEKKIPVAGRKITGFFDIYNLLNSNGEQALTTTSGSSFLLPTAITAPRIARVGIRLDW